jgi:Peptidase family M28
MLIPFVLASVIYLTPTSDDAAISNALNQVSAKRLQTNVEALVGFGTRNTFSEKAGNTRGVKAASQWIFSQLKQVAKTSQGRMSVALDTFLQKADGQRVPRDVEITNVLAMLRGSEPGSRTYVICGHYDSRNASNDDAVKDAPGADDNASGTALVLEAARVLAPLSFKGTIIFAAYGAEEQGLLGSKHHAEWLKSQKVDVQGVLNNDIVGAAQGDDTINTVRIFSEALAVGSDAKTVNAQGNENDSPSRQLARFALEEGDARAAPLKGQLIYRADRFLRGGDHLSFNAQGFAAIRFVEPVENFEHQHQDVVATEPNPRGDLPRFLNYDYLLRVTRYNIAVVAHLAAGPGRLDNVTIDTKELTNASTLRWTAPAPLVQVEVLRRLTTDSTWTLTSRVAEGQSVTVPFSKDNWIFGVRAVDAAGRRGVVVTPTPVR